MRTCSHCLESFEGEAITMTFPKGDPVILCAKCYAGVQLLRLVVRRDSPDAPWEYQQYQGR